MCALARASNPSSRALARTLENSEWGQPPPKRFEPHLVQNVFALPPGGSKVVNRSAPPRIRIEVERTRPFNVPVPPESFLQLAQWQ